MALILEREFKQPVNVVNRTGGSGVVGHQAIATAAPDGYTFGLITLEINLMHWVGLTDLTYEKFTPLALVKQDFAAIHVKSDSPYKNVKELFATDQGEPEQAHGVGHGAGRQLACRARRPDCRPTALRPTRSAGCRPRVLRPR